MQTPTRSPKAPKTCPICAVELTAFSVSPTTCVGGHDANQRACGECWEAYLSTEIEEKPPEEIKCMFCPGKAGILSKTELKKLTRKGTFERYEEKLKRSTHFRCQARCRASKRDPNERNSPSVLQPHSRAKDGRVFECKFCSFKTCIDCDRPEHDDETCEEYRARAVNQPQHLKAEAATAAKFDRCPNAACAAFWEWESKKKGCGHTKCAACKFQFCGNCMLPWVGEGSAYLLGKGAHGDWCRYRRKEAESAYGLKRRHESDGQRRKRLKM